MLDHDEIVRLYGPWRHRTPADASAALRDYPGRWWIAGGWVVDAFTGTSRVHGDLDIGIPRGDLPLLLAHLHGRLDVWAAAGSLTPLVPGGTLAVPDDCGNLWLRRSGADPWEYDVLLEHVDGRTWTYKRDPRISRPLDEVLWESDGVSYLRPEVQLLLKAKHRRPQDDHDLQRCLGKLSRGETAWLSRTLRESHPGHPWIDLLT